MKSDGNLRWGGIVLIKMFSQWFWDIFNAQIQSKTDSKFT